MADTNFSWIEAESVGTKQDFIVLFSIGAEGAQGFIASLKRDGVYGGEDASAAGFDNL